MPAATSTPASTPPAPQKLTKKMRIAAEARLRTFRDSVYSLEGDNDVHGCTPLSAYFSNSTIASVLNNLL
jgi:hypothetical protein